MKKKLIAPIIITVLLVLYFIGYAVLIVDLGAVLPMPVKVIGFLIPIALAGVSIFVLVERIKEIRSGEEDDLSEY